LKYRVFEYRIPFIHPIRIGGSVQSERKGLYIRAQDEEGVIGWGEAAPLDGYGPDTFAEVCQSLSGPAAQFSPSLRFGMDCAHRAIDAQKRHMSFAEAIGSQVRHTIESAQLVLTRQSRDVRFLKSKVGSSDIDTEANRIADILDGLPSNGLLRLDANGIWSEEEAAEFARLLERISPNGVSKIEFIEEPWKACFSAGTEIKYPFPIAIDENFDLEHPGWHLADVVMIKPSLFGSIDEFLNARKILMKAGKRVVLSSAFETALGMSALVALASTLPGDAEGFGTYRYLVPNTGNIRQVNFTADPKGTTSSGTEQVTGLSSAIDHSWLLESPIDTVHVPDIPGEWILALGNEEDSLPQ